MGGGSPGGPAGGKWVPLVGCGAWSRGLAEGSSDKGPLREVGSGDNGLSVGGLGYCFPSLLPRGFHGTQPRLGHKCQWGHCVGVLVSRLSPWVLSLILEDPTCGGVAPLSPSATTIEPVV